MTDIRALKRKEKMDYLKEPGRCPFCKSTDIVGESVEIEGSSANQPVVCYDCGRRWTDVYELVDVVEGVC